MCSLRAATCAAICSFAFCGPLQAETLDVQNRSTNSVRVTSSAGGAVFGPGQAGDWVPTGTVEVFRDGVSEVSFDPAPGHSYSVVVGEASTSILDDAPASARWFMAGLAFSMIWGLTIMAFTWTRSIIGGGGVNEC